MITWTEGALHKLKCLKGQKDFISVSSFDDSGARLLFKNQICDITPFGKVTWHRGGKR